eukprot:TRINITY_DN299_c0_g4_i1.p1 TRINITY_DN299_c0_g4~~TRINITY_DN299_c0_g4_i1.p1  ORF type:complete len:352 (+),score=164.80 TRINITY_DN299_c0_g4_i1:53-1108(+)
MGCVPSNEVDIEQNSLNKRIDAQLSLDKKKTKNDVKLLLLGAGDSGKSTFAKQMKIIHLTGFNENDKLEFKNSIRLNIINYTQILLKAALKFNYQINHSNKEFAENVLNLNFTNATVQFNEEIAQKIKSILSDDAIKQSLERYSEFQLSDSAPYFFGEIDRIANVNYIPSDADILRVRIRTSGIVEVCFQISDFYFRIFDVGGQRSERKKWLHCFDSATAIIFVVALSEYDLFLEENVSINRMQESLRLFDDIINNNWFAATPIILLLNKKDLFEEKINRVDPKICFSDYNGGLNKEKAQLFIQKKYTATNLNSERQLFTHFTCATDTQNIKVVFSATREIILDIMLRILF